MLNELQERWCSESPADYSDLKALILNCTLKRSPELSHTDGLIRISQAIMEKNGVAVEVLRPVDHAIAFGVYPDMTEQGWAKDDWPGIYEKVAAADILVITSPIWLGEKSSVCTQTIERLYANSSDLNEAGQYGLLRQGRRLPDHRQRGRRQALLDEHPLFAPAPGLRHPAAGRRGLARGRRAPGPPISTRARAARRTTSPTATPPS